MWHQDSDDRYEEPCACYTAHTTVRLLTRSTDSMAPTSASPSTPAKVSRKPRGYLTLSGSVCMAAFRAAALRR